MLALIVDAALRAKAGVQPPEIAARALAAGVAGYVLLAVLEYGWNVLGVPAKMNAESHVKEAALRAALDERIQPPLEGVRRRQDRLRGWIAERGSATATKSVLWLSDVVAKDHVLAHYVVPLQELAAQMGDALKIRETTRLADGTVTDIEFKVRRWW